ncbi:MAG TPA: helix-hairpin-helix domain-containing protein [Roseiflexaceae bacterium]|nr:helix-hairpin-helix domain-containing protein [Roseiflexaceae bacterium]
MTNRQIAAVLFNISAILAQQHGNPYRIRAYRRAARNLLRLRHQVAERAAAGQPLGVPRLGKSLAEKIATLATRDRLPFYEELCGTLPEGRLLLVPGIGPTTARRILRDLGRADDATLRRAAATGRLQRVWGVGPKRVAAILDAVGRDETVGQQERLAI